MRNCILEGMKKPNGVAILVVVFLGLLLSAAAIQWQTETVVDRGMPTLVRINRFTGKTEVFSTQGGWRPATPPRPNAQVDALVQDVLAQTEADRARVFGH